MLVAATGDDDGGNSAGAAYLFNLDDLDALPTKFFVPNTAEDELGQISLYEDHVFAGATRFNNLTGKVYMWDADDLLPMT